VTETGQKNGPSQTDIMMTMVTIKW